MGFKDSDLGTAMDELKINTHYLSQLNQNKKSSQCDHDKIESDAKSLPVHSGTGKDMMDFTTILEAMDEILTQAQSGRTSEELGSAEVDSTDNSDLLDKLDRIFTPVLVMQKMEQSIADESNKELADSGTLTEKTMISFDDPDRMAQLQSVCALLIAQKKNTENWQLYKKAAAVKNQSKLNIQKEEYEAAKNLAQKYLIKVSTTNNSAVARDAAKELLPQTQH